MRGFAAAASGSTESELWNGLAAREVAEAC